MKTLTLAIPLLIFITDIIIIIVHITYSTIFEKQLQNLFF